MRENIPYLFVLAAAVLWGTTGTAQTFAPEAAHPIAIGAIRLAVGGGTLLLILFLFGSFSLKGLSFRETMLAAVSMACYQPFFFSAVTLTGVAVGTVVAIGSAPVLAGMLERMVFNKRQTKAWWFATFLSVIGCVTLFLNNQSVTVQPTGILLAIGAGLSFAVYSLTSKRLILTNKPLSVTAIVFTISGILLSPILFLFDLSWLAEARGVVVSLQLGIVATSLAYLLFSLGLKGVPSATAVTLSLAEPLTAALLGVLLVGEILSPVSWSGIILLLSGIVLLTVGQKGKSRKDDVNLSASRG
ncbi:EamA family transporter [Sediminibacillus albus]|uniref:Drug/metabolite transporter, DME family n=1 Tax=Sediminibacillus albus TaxID=407036 RepID=A0A1G8ZZB5_9BACI|nr:EamA family transporter [Sediminibacillus albus]SDK20446.1 drug/metabolite transporter, DME family [Sediminibacillus albus]